MSSERRTTPPCDVRVSLSAEQLARLLVAAGMFVASDTSKASDMGHHVMSAVDDSITGRHHSLTKGILDSEQIAAVSRMACEYMPVIDSEYVG